MTSNKYLTPLSIPTIVLFILQSLVQLTTPLKNISVNSMLESVLALITCISGCCKPASHQGQKPGIGFSPESPGSGRVPGMMSHSHCVIGYASTRMNEKANKSTFMMGMWFGLAQLQNLARSPTATIKDSPSSWQSNTVSRPWLPLSKGVNRSCREDSK